jgi:hypothetical protein
MLAGVDHRQPRTAGVERRLGDRAGAGGVNRRSALGRVAAPPRRREADRAAGRGAVAPSRDDLVDRGGARARNAAPQPTPVEARRLSPIEIVRRLAASDRGVAGADGRVAVDLARAGAGRQRQAERVGDKRAGAPGALEGAGVQGDQAPRACRSPSRESGTSLQPW